MKMSKYKKSEWFFYILGSLAMTLAIIGEYMNIESKWLTGVILVLIIVAPAQVFIVCRCPKCGACLLGKYGEFFKKCPDCGRKIEY